MLLEATVAAAALSVYFPQYAPVAGRCGVSAIDGVSPSRAVPLAAASAAAAAAAGMAVVTASASGGAVGDDCALLRSVMGEEWWGVVGPWVTAVALAVLRKEEVRGVEGVEGCDAVVSAAVLCLSRRCSREAQSIDAVGGGGGEGGEGGEGYDNDDGDIDGDMECRDDDDGGSDDERVSVMVAAMAAQLLLPPPGESARGRMAGFWGAFNHFDHFDPDEGKVGGGASGGKRAVDVCRQLVREWTVALE